MTGAANPKETIQHLARQLRRYERTGRPQHDGLPLTTGIPALDELLPEQGIGPGTLMEWLSEGAGSGAGATAFIVAAHAMQAGGACVVIDKDRSFFPPAVLWRSPKSEVSRSQRSEVRGWKKTAALPPLISGLCPLISDLCPEGPPAGDLDRTVVVHPTNDRDVLWALEQSLRCRSVAAVVCWLNRLHAHAYRRLQLAAEAGGGIGLLLRSAEYRFQPSWADIRLLVEALPFESRCGRKPSSGTDAFSIGRLLRIELISCRGRAGGGAVELPLFDFDPIKGDDETGDVRLASRLAAATDTLRAAGA
jgi:protein ImuA